MVENELSDQFLNQIIHYFKLMLRLLILQLAKILLIPQYQFKTNKENLKDASVWSTKTDRKREYRERARDRARERATNTLFLFHSLIL